MSGRFIVLLSCNMVIPVRASTAADEGEDTGSGMVRVRYPQADGQEIRPDRKFASLDQRYHLPSHERVYQIPSGRNPRPPNLRKRKPSHP